MKYSLRTGPLANLEKDEELVRFGILGIGVVSPLGLTKEVFWQSINECRPFYQQISDAVYGELNGFCYMKVEELGLEDYLDEKQLHNLDRNSIFISLASKFAIQDSGLEISKISSDETGVTVGTSISIGTSMSDFDESVLREGYRRSKIGIFPNAVMCAPASRVAIFEHITGPNTTISSGKNSGIDAIGHACFYLEKKLSKIMIAGGSDALSEKILLGYSKEGLLLTPSTGMQNKRGAFIPSEGAGVLVLGKVDQECSNPQAYGEILSYACGFSPYNRRDIILRGENLYTILEDCLSRTNISSDDINCVLMSNYFDEFDYQTEFIALKRLFRDTIQRKIILAPKKMFGESFAPHAIQLVILGIGLFNNQISPQAIEYLSEIQSFSKPDENEKIKYILITHVDSGGHQSALVLKSN